MFFHIYTSSCIHFFNEYMQYYILIHCTLCNNKCIFLSYKNHNFFRKVLLNNKPLNLINDKNLPDIYPEIILNPDGLELELPSGAIGFWIVPNAKVIEITNNYFAYVCTPLTIRR